MAQLPKVVFNDNPETRYTDWDVHHIVEAVKKQGYSIDVENARKAWRAHSALYGKEWEELPSDPESIWYHLERYVIPEDFGK